MTDTKYLSIPIYCEGGSKKASKFDVDRSECTICERSFKEGEEYFEFEMDFIRSVFNPILCAGCVNVLENWG